MAAWMLIAAGIAMLAVAVLVVSGILMLLARRVPEPPPAAMDLSIDVDALDSAGPPADAVRIELYGTPVRLAVFVLAPVGRDGTVPSKEQLPDLLEQLVPGFLQIVSSHGPLLRFWPNQLSSHGFMNAFFNKISLPGDRGKGTRWCSVAGKFTAQGTQFLAGLVCCADQPNGLGQFMIEREGQWNDVLRIRS